MNNSELIRIQVELAREANHIGMIVRRMGLEQSANRWFATARDHMGAARQEKANQPKR